MSKLSSAIKRVNFGFRNIISEQNLSALASYHTTDKANGSHTFNNISYLDIYEKYFCSIRNDDIALLEIGIRGGASLRLWKSYFKNAKIHGIDIDPRCKQFEEKRIDIEIGSQDDIDFLQRCFGQEKKFDIIIDDGSHVNSLTIESFEYLFNNRLNSGGIYIIEDLNCSYKKLQTDYNVLETWPGMKCNDPSTSFDNDRKDLDNLFLEKIKQLDHFEGNILCLHFWSMVCVIVKA